jgi:hypothetical protein
MSVILHKIIQYRELDKIKNTKMTNYEILENTRKLWLNRHNDIHSVMRVLTSKNCIVILLHKINKKIDTEIYL